MLTVYPASLAPSDVLATTSLGGLPYSINDRVSQQINGDWRLTLQYPVGKPGDELLALENLIMAEGQLYRIRRRVIVDESGKQLLDIEAPHIAFDLQDYCIENIETDADDETLDGVTARQAMTQLLAGTPFSVGSITVSDTYRDYLDVLQKPALEAIKNQLVPKWGGELVFNNWTISLLSECGQDRKYPIRRGKNITALKYTEDLTDTVTRLHVIGYGGADIKPVNDDLDYLDSTYIDRYSHVREGYATFDDEDDPAALKALGLAHLPKVENPKISFDISLAQLKGSPEYKHYAALETFELGDTALLHHDALGADVPLRCQAREFVASTGVNVSVKLGNTEDELTAAFSSVREAASLVKRVSSGRVAVNASFLEGEINALLTRIRASAAYQNAAVHENEGLLLENTQVGSPAYGALYLGPGVFAIANARGANGAWNWRTFGTGAGFSADQITAGTLSAARIDVNSLNLSLNQAFQTTLQTMDDAIQARVTQTDFNTLEDGVTAAAARMTNIEQTANDVTIIVSRQEEKIDEAIGEQIKLQTYLQFAEDGLTLGKLASPFKAKMDQTRLAFLEDNVPVAYLSNQQLYVLGARAINELQVGGYAIIKQPDGGLSMTWRGEGVL